MLTGMRVVTGTLGALVFASFASCASSAPAPTPAITVTTVPAAPATLAPPLPIELALVEHDGERAITWTPDLEMVAPSEDGGLVGYAQRATPLLAADKTILGSLEPGARVGIVRIEGERAAIALFPWGSRAEHPAAIVAIRDLGPRPPRPATASPSRAAHDAAREQRVIRRGQSLNAHDGKRIAWTFCGTVDVLGEDSRGTRIAQRDAGITLEGYVAKHVWADRPCPGPLLVDDWNRTRQLITNDRWRSYREPALPAGLVEAGPFTAPDFASLVAKRTRLWWLFPGDDDEAPSCSEWRLEPRPASRGAGRGEAQLVARTRNRDGTSHTTRFSVEYSTDLPPAPRPPMGMKGASSPASTTAPSSAPSSTATASAPSSSATPPGSPMATTTVILLGPTSEVYDRRGNVTSSVGYGCGQDFAIVASDASGLLMHREPPSLNARILAYAPGDTERWYLDKSSCEKDLERRRERVAGAPNGHAGC
jgi:hypothetical protein